jgi:hypothetical protein
MTAEAKHTRGPWELLGGFTVGSETGSAWERIAITPDDLPELERIANARLIAAAPELLEALDECVNALEDYIPRIEAQNEMTSLNYGRNVMAVARAAIRRAKGEK